MRFLMAGIVWSTRKQWKVRACRSFVILRPELRNSRNLSAHGTTALLHLWIYNFEGKIYSASTTTGKQQESLLHRYGSVVEDLPFFSAQGACRKFIDHTVIAVSYTHLRAHETDSYLVCRLLLE